MSSGYHRVLARTADIRAVLKKAPPLKALMRGLGVAVGWLNHFRHQVVITVEGITYDLDLNESIDANLYGGGSFEPELTLAISVLTKPGDVVIDIGANIGVHTLAFSKRVGPSGRVIAFEPTAYAFDKMQRNLALNAGFSDNVTVEKAAIGGAGGGRTTVRIKSSWLLYGPQREIVEETVDLVSVDEYVTGHGLDSVDILKIDVDGNEAIVIDSASETLRVHRPVMFLEVNDTPDCQPMIEVLIRLGYIVLFEENFEPLQSVAEVMARVMERPVNSTGYRAANFILLPEAGSDGRVRELQRAMNDDATIDRPRGG